MTRQQMYLTRALEDVTAVKEGVASEQTRTVYGGLCHSFPVLVRAAGLCQALAFVEDKACVPAAGDRAEAYKLLRRHVARHLGVAEPAQLLHAMQADSNGVVAYMRQTRVILDAWVYYKRFARSILQVDSAQAADEAEVRA